MMSSLCCCFLFYKRLAFLISFFFLENEWLLFEHPSSVLIIYKLLSLSSSICTIIKWSYSFIKKHLLEKLQYQTQFQVLKTQCKKERWNAYFHVAYILIGQDKHKQKLTVVSTEKQIQQCNQGMVVTTKDGVVLHVKPETSEIQPRVNLGV